ncbi:MAG TPA: MFS transporter [Candidatus Desulfaltia sp.]|nr:MFS transporter [Candidatus Desulfaltia sp.]
MLRYPGVLLGGFMALATLSVMNSAYSTVLDTIKAEMSLSYSQAGALMSAYFIGYALGQIPWGLLADRKGSRPAIALSVLGVSSATILFGFSGDLTSALITRFLTGLLGAGVFVPCVRLVSAWYNSDERGTALGVLNIGGSLGLILASWAAPLLALRIGWRPTTGLIGAGGVIVAALIWLLVKDGDQSSYGRINLSSLPLRSRDFWLLASTQFIRLGSYYTFIAWLPLVLKEEYGLGVVATSGVLSLFNLAGMFANPLGGVVSDKVGKKVVIFASFLLMGLDLLVFSQTISGILVYAAVFLLGWFINFVRSPAFTIIPDIFGTESAGSISGIHNTFASLGALALPFTLGLIRDTTGGYAVGWAALSVLMFTASTLIYYLRVPEG